MLNSHIMRKIVVGSEYAPLSRVALPCSVEISCAPANAGVVYFRGDDGSDVPWQPGEYHPFKSIDLSQLFIKGTDGDVVTVIGGTW